MYSYYIFLCVLFSLSLYPISQNHNLSFYLSILYIPSLLLGFFYLQLMWRVGGVDFENYLSYHEDPDLIPDIGYRFLAECAQYFSMSFTHFLFFQALFTIYCIYRYSKSISGLFLISLGIFVIHSAIVRDLSQSRVGLAAAFIFLAYAQKNNFYKFILLLISCFVHLSVFPAVFLFWLSDQFAHLKLKLLVIILATFFFASFAARGNLTGVFYFIDPRVGTYLSMDGLSDSAPPSDYVQIAFYALMCGLSILAYYFSKNMLFKKFAILAYFSILIFIALSDASIFAYRVSHVAMIFYPFILTKILLLNSDNLRNTNLFLANLNMANLKILSGFVSILVLTISFRPSNREIIDQIVPFIKPWS